MIVTEYPPCDNDESHQATVHCPECEESFCEACDQLIHARKKNREHEREYIDLAPEEEEEPPAEEEIVPCDSDAAHVAVMFCEDCEENFCNECDYTFHSRKKTANHRRYEGSRTPAVVAALKAEEEAQVGGADHAVQQMHINEHKHQQAPPAKTTPATAAATTAAAAAAAARQSNTAAKAGPSAAASAKPAATKAGSALTTFAAAAGGAKPIAGAKPVGGRAPVSSTTAPAAAAAAAASSTQPAPKASDPKATSADRVAEHRAAWLNLQRTLCKQKYNVGHWLGLSTQDRKDLAIALCQELLFNPQPKPDGPITTEVIWSATSYWTTYEVDVECVKTMTDTKDPSRQRITTYKVHVDDAGRLLDFSIASDGVAQGCGIM